MDLSANISITDNLTAPLRNMASAVNSISSNLKSLESTSGKLDSKQIESMNRATQVLEYSMKDLEGSTRKTVSVVSDETGKLNANKQAADSLSSSLKDVEHNADEAFNNSANGSDNLSGRLSGVTKAAMAAAAAIAAIGAAGKALWDGVNAVAEFGDNIDKTSQKIGISAEAYQEWDYVFERCGASVDNLQMGMKTLSSVIADAGAGSTEAATKLAAVGLSVEELNDKSQDEQLSIVISKLQEMGSGAQRTAAAADLLGRSSTDMAAVLNMTAEETEALKQETRDYGMVMSNESVKASAAFEDSLTRLKSTFTGIKNNILGDFLPSLTNALDAFSGFGAEIGNRIRDAMSTEEFQEGMNRLQEALANLAPKIQDMAAGITEKLPDILNGIVGAFNWFIDNADTIGAVLSAIGAGLAAYQAYSFVSGIITAITTATEGLTVAQALLNVVMSANPIGILITLLGALVGVVIYLWNTNEGFRNAVIAVWDAVVGAFQNAWNNISGFFASFSGAWDTAVQSVQNFWTNLSSTFSGLWEAFKSWGANLILGFLEGLLAGWMPIINWFSNTFGWIIDFVKNLFGIASPSTVFSDIGLNLLQGFYNGIVGFWGTITGWFNETVLGFFENIGNAISGFWNNLFGGGNQQETTMQPPDYSAAIEQTQQAFDKLKAYCTQVFIDIGNILVTSTISTLTQVAGLYSNLSAQLAGIFTGITAAVTMGMAQISTAIAGDNSIATALELSFQIAKDRALTSLYELQVQAYAAMGQLITSLGDILANLNGVFLEAFNQVQANTINTLNQIQAQSVAVILSLGDGFIGALSNMTSAAAGLLVAMSTTIVGTIQTMVTSVLNVINSVLVSQFIAAWRTTQTQTISILVSLSTSAVRTLSTMASSIMAVMNKLANDFKSIGSIMMDDLVSGIRSKTQTVLDTTSELVSKMKEIFVTGLGIHSPSKFMTYIGQMMSEGLLRGLSSAQIQKFVESIVGNMKDAFKNGTFDPKELVQYLDDDTLKLIEYLNVTGDNTTSDNMNQGADSMIAYPLVGTRGTQSSWFGWRDSPGGIGSRNHQGVDLATATGTPIVSALAGTVTTAGWYGGYGNAVVVDSGNGLSIVYGHMSAVGTSVGAQVGKGQQIGLVGSTGNSTGPHLHFEIRQNGTPIDPQPYIDGAAPLVGAAPTTLAGVIQQAYNLAKGIVPATAGSSTIGDVPYDISAGAQQWTPQVLQALQMLGQPESLLNYVLYAIDCESSGNPNAVNLTDSNAAAGYPSRGLLQTIPQTFEAYRNPSLSDNINDPLANIYAGLNYMIHEYGSIAAVVEPRLDGWEGYARGTKNATPGLHWVGEKGPELLMFSGGEQVIPHDQSVSLTRNAENFGESILLGMDPVQVYNSIDIPLNGYARGTKNAIPGLHWIGEEGPELLNYSDGEQIIPFNQSAALSRNIESSRELVLLEMEPKIRTFGDGDQLIPDQSETLTRNTEAFENSVLLGMEPTTGIRDSLDMTEPAVDTTSYVESGSTTTNQQTNNSPITLNFNPTINTREEFNLSVAEMKRMMAQAVNDIRSNYAEGFYD